MPQSNASVAGPIAFGIFAMLGACGMCAHVVGDTDGEAVTREPRGRELRELEAARSHEAQARQTEATEAQRQVNEEAARRQRFQRMTPTQREKALVDACRGGSCDEQAVHSAIQAAATPAEGARLQQVWLSLTAASRAKSRAAVPQERPRDDVGRVCCCDGTVSPTCTTVRSGCCSRHGGVCACN